MTEMTPQQFDLNAMLATPKALQNSVQQIPLEMLHPYHKRYFAMYEGERLEDMVESIRTNGVICPIIVQKDAEGYEIIIGHNRWNASKIAGKDTIPAIIKEGLTEEEADNYYTESNIIQRGFDNLKISEQASVIVLRHNTMFSQGKRNDIIKELTLLENPDADISELNSVDSKSDTGKEVGIEYGISKGSVVRLMRIDKLIDELKVYVDSGEIAIRSGVELSFLSEESQLEVACLFDDFRINMTKARQLHEKADSNGNIDKSEIFSIMSGTVNIQSKPKSVKIGRNVFEKYFSPDTKPKEITDTVEKALEFYFREKDKIQENN